MAIGKIAKEATHIASDVWQGMSKGVQRGRNFTTKGGNKAKVALNNMNKLKQVRYMDKGTMKMSSVSNGTRLSPNANKNIARQVGNFFGQGTRDTIGNMKNNDMNFNQALKQGHKTNGKLDTKKMAGTYMLGSGAARIASGGGITKDKNGNNNLIGIPFI